MRIVTPSYNQLKKNNGISEVETEKPSTENTPSSSVTPSEKPAPVPREQTDPPKVETPAATTINTEPVVTSDTPSPTPNNKEITESEEEEPTTEELVTLDDFDTKTRGPPLVPTDFKETETSTTLLPTVAEVTTDGGVTSEVVFESTEYGEVVTIDFDSGNWLHVSIFVLSEIFYRLKTPRKSSLYLLQYCYLASGNEI